MTSPRKTLLSIGHSYAVGVNRRLPHEMALAGADRWDVTVAAPAYFHGGNDLRPVTLVKMDDEPCPLEPIPAYGTKRVHTFLYGLALRSLLRRPWDVIHCWEEPYILAGGQLAWWANPCSKLVFRTAQSLNKRYPPPFNWIERRAMRRANGWICSGQTVAENLLRRPGYAERPMRRLPLGVDLTRFKPDLAAGAALRQRMGWTSNGPPVVGYLGRLSPEKGIPMLMRALDAVTMPWRALFVGAGVLESEVRAWAAKHGERVRVQTNVAHDEVPPYVNAMDIMCAPSQTMPNWREQFGRMLIEAFACQVMVIGSDSGEIPLVLGDAGLVIGENDEAGWIAAITEALANEPRRRELGERGRRRALDHFGWPAIARQHLDFFEELLRGA